ncbi:MAG: ABC transporter permease [Romboutsia sp.]
MSVTNLLRTAISSLKFHKLRTFLTMIGIIIGISSVVAILSVGDGFKEYVVKSSQDTNSNKMTVYFQPENSNADMSLIEPFTNEDMYGIRNINGVEKVTKAQAFMGMMSLSSSQMSYFDKSVTGFLDTYNGRTKNVEYGTWFTGGSENNNDIVLDYNTAKDLFDPINSGLGRAVTINGENFEVIGIMPEVKGMSLEMPANFISKKAKESMDFGDTIFALDINIKHGFDKRTVFKGIDKYLKANHGNIQGKYEMQDPAEMTKVFESIIGGLTKFIAFITGISLIVGGIGVMNIMYVSVSERKREIGIRRAIGAKPSSILLQFLFEAILVTLIGGLIGILLGYLISKIAGAFLPFAPTLTMGTFIGATLVSVIEGVVFGIIPAYNACKMDPIKAIYK